MGPERWRAVERLFQAAFDLQPAQRAAFLNQACGEDKSLRREVESLLAETNEGKEFLEAPALEVAARALARSPAPAATLLPAHIGRYRIVRLLGEGGMGAVYEAEQEEPSRVVALKVMRPGLATPETLRRFRNESEALGRLQHPGIAQIYEANTADTGFGPQPFFAMELIRGLPLRQYVEAHKSGVRERLQLMAKTCEAVEHAHQRGLIHRDLKPGNVMVDDAGQPKILDFGVARLTSGNAETTSRTTFGEIVGTLAYMSPEQALADPEEVDARSDVYSLGVILYELLSGRRPFEVNSRPLPEAARMIREEDPLALGSIDRAFRGDIETIAAKALEKDKARRYPTAADLAADIERYLRDEPIAARPATAGYQLRKFVRRHRALVAGVAAVFVALMGGVIAATSQAVRANREGQAARRQRDRAASAERAAELQRDTARTERNRALAAETKAVEERNRALAEKQRADNESATAKAVSDFLQNDLLAQAGARVQARPDINPDPNLTVRTALDRAAVRIPGKFDRQPLVEAAIRQTIGNTYLDLGVFPQARRQMERALELRRHALGEEHPDTLSTMSRLGWVYRLQGMYAEAEALSSKTLEARQRVLGTSHPDTVESMSALALVYENQGKLAKAEVLCDRILEIVRRERGDNPTAVANAMYHLAEVYRAERRYSEAEPLAVKSIESLRRLLGEEHPLTLAVVDSLAAVYRLEGRLPEAEALLLKLSAVQRRVFGEDHPRTLATMNTLAATYQAEGRYPEAESLYSKAIEMLRRVRGENHPITAATMNLLALLYRAEGKYTEAETLFRAALEIRSRALGPQHPATTVVLASLGEAQLQRQEYADAESLARQALHNWEKTRPNSWMRYYSESLLGASLSGQKRYQEAEPLLLSGRRGIMARAANLRDENRQALTQTGEWIVELYKSWGKPEKAAEWQDKLRAGN